MVVINEISMIHHRAVSRLRIKGDTPERHQHSYQRVVEGFARRNASGFLYEEWYISAMKYALSPSSAWTG